MDGVLDFGLQATRWLQANYPQLEGFFRFMSTLGLEQFYLAVVPLLYWCVDKQLGRQLAYVFILSSTINPLAKHGLRGPRPYWLDPSLERWPETSYGVPSNHAQLATTIYLFLAGWYRRSWLWVLAILILLAMAVSRVYLGAHFVHDVVVGILLALLVLFGYLIWNRVYARRFARRILGFRLMVAVLVPLVLGLAYVIMVLLLGPPDASVAWAPFQAEAELSGIEGMATAVGYLLGAGIGFTLESSRVRFLMAGSTWQRAGRYLLGLIVTLALWQGLGQILPRDPLWLAIPLRILRYMITMLWASYYAPMAFVRLRLAAAEPEPGISMTL